MIGGEIFETPAFVARDSFASSRTDVESKNDDSHQKSGINDGRVQNFGGKKSCDI